MRRTAGILVIALLAAALPAAQAAPPWPVPGSLRTEFDPPEPDWLPGHRGLDLTSAPGTPVATPVAGVVLFAGTVAGVPVLVIRHGITRATYQPAVSDLPVGAPVQAGQVVGTVATGGHCSSECLHWGLRLGDTYLDPRLLLGSPHVVLRPVP